MSRWSMYKPKFKTGDLITSTGEDRLMVYRHDSSALKYTIYNLRTNTVTYEPKHHMDEHCTKIGEVDVESVIVLYL